MDRTEIVTALVAARLSLTENLDYIHDEMSTIESLADKIIKKNSGSGWKKIKEVKSNGNYLVFHKGRQLVASYTKPDKTDPFNPCPEGGWFDIIGRKCYPTHFRELLPNPK